MGFSQSKSERRNSPADYDDWEVGGPTAFVPGLRHTSNRSLKDQADKLYAAERCAQYTRGTVLICTSTAPIFEFAKRVAG